MSELFRHPLLPEAVQFDVFESVSRRKIANDIHTSAPASDDVVCFRAHILVFPSEHIVHIKCQRRVDSSNIHRCFWKLPFRSVTTNPEEDYTATAFAKLTSAYTASYGHTYIHTYTHNEDKVVTNVVCIVLHLS